MDLELLGKISLYAMGIVLTASMIELAIPISCMACTQQIRGNWSPASMSTMRVVPRPVRMVTSPLRS